MGANGDARVNARDDKRAKAREARGGRRRAEGSYPLTLGTYAVLVALSDAFASRGGAVRIGLTRDGGALALGVYYEEDYATEYVRPAEDIWQAAREIAGAWLPDGDDALAAAVTRLNLEDWISGR